MIRDGVHAEWIPPKEGVLSWVCGLGITSNAENIDAAYKLINYYVSPEAQAVAGESGFVVMNPKAVPLIDPEFQETADPQSLRAAIPEVTPDAADLYDRAWQEVAAG
jgi:spermidine/putrescine transport system substrate-binding protein